MANGAYDHWVGLSFFVQTKHCCGHASENNKSHSLAINIHIYYIPQYIIPDYMLKKYDYISDGYMDIYGEMVHPRGDHCLPYAPCKNWRKQYQ